MLKELPDLAERFVETVLLNPDIWVRTSRESQARVMIMARGLAGEFADRLRADRFVDMLTHCIETLADSDREDRTDTIAQISELVVLWAKQGLSEAVLSKITSYANIYYIRRLRAYPMQLYYVLRILLSLFVECISAHESRSVGEESLMTVIRSSIKHKRESKTVTTLLLALDYIIYFRNNGVAGEYPGKQMVWNAKSEEEEKTGPVAQSEACTIVDETLFHFANDSQVVDGVQAVAMYLLLTFDVVRETIKDYQKDLPYYSAVREPAEEKKGSDLPTSRYGRDLLSFILRSSQKMFSGSARTPYFDKRRNRRPTHGKLHIHWRRGPRHRVHKFLERPGSPRGFI